MTAPELIDINTLASGLLYCVETFTCDSPSNLQSSRIWLFSGASDTIVVPGVVKKNEAFFRQYVPENSIKAIYGYNVRDCLFFLSLASFFD